MQKMVNFTKRLIKTAAYLTPLARFIGHRYPYNFNPAQLCYLFNCLDRTSMIHGPILEIGCFVGCTSVWLNKHMDSRGIEKPYIAIDTFSGFVESDVEYEVTKRQKPIGGINAFTPNSKIWFDKNMELNGITRVKSIQVDVNSFDYTGIQDVSFALIDVDLYLPVKRALERIYGLLGKGGIIVVDDC